MFQYPPSRTRRFRREIHPQTPLIASRHDALSLASGGVEAEPADVLKSEERS
jgi:hypothetical protein